LADMAENRTVVGSQRMLVAAKSAADDLPLASWLKHEGFEVMIAVDDLEALQVAGYSW
jgi:hypothetical protein